LGGASGEIGALGVEWGTRKVDVLGARLIGLAEHGPGPPGRGKHGLLLVHDVSQPIGSIGTTHNLSKLRVVGASVQ
jgi:hypothetical protein